MDYVTVSTLCKDLAHSFIKQLLTQNSSRDRLIYLELLFAVHKHYVDLETGRPLDTQICRLPCFILVRLCGVNVRVPRVLALLRDLCSRDLF